MYDSKKNKRTIKIRINIKKFLINSIIFFFFLFFFENLYN